MHGQSLKNEEGLKNEIIIKALAKRIGVCLFVLQVSPDWVLLSDQAFHHLSGDVDPFKVLKMALFHFCRLEEGWLDRLTFQLKADCDLLQRLGIMDYSLLLGLHYCNREPHSNGRAVNFAGKSTLHLAKLVGKPVGYCVRTESHLSCSPAVQ